MKSNPLRPAQARAPNNIVLNDTPGFAPRNDCRLHASDLATTASESHLWHVEAGPGAGAAEHLPQQHAEGVDVRRRRQLAARQQLRRLPFVEMHTFRPDLNTWAVSRLLLCEAGAFRKGLVSALCIFRMADETAARTLDKAFETQRHSLAAPITPT